MPGLISEGLIMRRLGWTIGLILALLGLGVFLSYRVYHLVDLTADGSFGIGVAVAAALLVKGVPPLLATVPAPR